MIAEVRIYTANRPQNEFVWIRVFENEAERDAKIESSFASPPQTRPERRNVPAHTP